MSLASRLKEVDKNKSNSGLPCPLGRLIHILEPEDSKALQTALDLENGQPDWLSSSAIVKALREEGHDVGQTAVQRHRRRMCRCYGANPKV